VSLSSRFRENIDPEYRSFVGAFDDVKRCSGRMTWLISKGEEIVQGTFKTVFLGREYSPGEEQVFEKELYSCTLADAPEYSDHTAVEEVGMIKTRFPADFDYGPGAESRFNPRLGTRGRYVHRFSYETQVVFGSKGSNLIFKNVINGKVISMADIVFE